ncbi:hypothetical protein ABW21_db0203503 [Orbilia brochopaga]|nr:hypothetical protein ABW21_db0203503 [Drechslerella brochopaga]
MQLMAEDTLAANSSHPPTSDRFTAAFTDEDIRTNTYEGGLKSWECSSDLVKQLAEDDATWQPSCRRVLELGCGTALPTCYLLQRLLASPPPQPPLLHGVHLTLADYNVDVLRLVTLPNLLLAYVYAASYTAPPTEQVDEVDGEDAKVQQDANAELNETEISISQHLITSFTTALAARNITISFLSGSWSADMVSLIHSAAGSQHVPVTTSLTSTMATLLLASETIYSPSSIAQFADMVEWTVNPVDGRGYIAAKDVYFGVGGSVADFVRLMQEKGWQWEVVREEKRGVGVGRVVGVVRKT